MVFQIATAIRKSLTTYNKKIFFKDLQAGITVALVALPLGMALGIASGVPPQNGLYTVVIAGFLTALLGGSRVQVTGPTAAFVVLLVPIVHEFGLPGLLTAGFLSGFVLMAIALSGLAKLIQFVPHPVTTGFTSGIAVVIGVIQIKDFMGFSLDASPENFFHRVSLILKNLPQFSLLECGFGAMTLTLILVSLRYLKRAPAPILAIGTASILGYLFSIFIPEWVPKTIGSEFQSLSDGILIQGIPQGFPQLEWPWLYGGESSFTWNWENLQSLFPSAFAIALLGAIESLLSATVADGITGERHNPHSETLALGVANIVTPFFGGIPATGAIARTSTNVRFGARTPVASMLHALCVLLVLLFLAPLVSYIPIAALAALLLFVSYNMFEKRHFLNVLKKGSLEDKSVLLTVFGLTIVFDMVIGVGVGVVLASLLTVKRFAEMTQVEVLKEFKSSPLPPFPKEFFYFRIRGSLFFGAAQKAVETMAQISKEVRYVILDARGLEFMDMTGLVALDTSLRDIALSGKQGILIHPLPAQEGPFKDLETLAHFPGQLKLEPDLEAALKSLKESSKN